MTTRLGWKKDKYDRRDYLHPYTRVPVRASHVLPTVEVRDQGNEGSCVGFGVGGNLSSLGFVVNLLTEWFSPRWIYNGAKFVGGYLDSEGAYPRDAMEWMRTRGCLLEHFWEYTANKDSMRPPPSQFNDEASKYPIVSYYRVTGGIDAICDALYKGFYVSIGIPWFEEWMSPGPSGVLPRLDNDSYPSGGHEVFLYGYDMSQNLFFGQNSWSKEWGNDGRFLMPFQAFEYFGIWGGYDAHYVKVDWSTPQPDPEPTPPDPEPDRKSIKIYYSIDDEKFSLIGRIDT